MNDFSNMLNLIGNFQIIAMLHSVTIIIGTSVMPTEALDVPITTVKNTISINIFSEKLKSKSMASKAS